LDFRCVVDKQSQRALAACFGPVLIECSFGAPFSHETVRPVCPSHDMVCQVKSVENKLEWNQTDGGKRMAMVVIDYGSIYDSNGLYNPSFIREFCRMVLCLTVFFHFAS
jgi:hypothetical protein